MQQNPDGFAQIDLFSPSKINLFLRIVRRREDGYHDLASLFHVIDLGDEMSFAKSSSETKDTLVCEDASIPLDESNLVIKALNLFRAKTRIKQYFWVELKKTVPQDHVPGDEKKLSELTDSELETELARLKLRLKVHRFFSMTHFDPMRFHLLTQRSY